MKRWRDKRSIGVVTACAAAGGMSDFAFTEVEVTRSQYENGDHYKMVEDRLSESGYEGQFVHFDEFDAPAFLIPPFARTARWQLIGNRSKRSTSCHVTRFL